MWRFHLPIEGLLAALQKRIESGSTIKAGPFEIAEQLRPQYPEEQKKKLDAELLEVGPPSLNEQLSTPSDDYNFDQAVYLNIEDMALRAIQADYGNTINRQVTTGSDLGFDGAFVINGQLHIVEVKYIQDLTKIRRLRKSVDRIVSTIEKMFR